MAKTIIVNENDEIIGLKDREEVGPDTLYRVSALWITNSKDEILLAKRALTKTHDPGKWGPAVAGTLEDDETYDSNIIKEAEEELGLKNFHFEKGPKERVSKEYNYFLQWYILKIDKPLKDLKIQEKEVAEVRWFSKEELLYQLSTNPNDFLPRLKENFKLLSKY